MKKGCACVPAPSHASLLHQCIAAGGEQEVVSYLGEVKCGGALEAQTHAAAHEAVKRKRIGGVGRGRKLDVRRTVGGPHGRGDDGGAGGRGQPSRAHSAVQQPLQLWRRGGDGRTGDLEPARVQVRLHACILCHVHNHARSSIDLSVPVLSVPAQPVLSAKLFISVHGRRQMTGNMPVRAMRMYVG